MEKIKSIEILSTAEIGKIYGGKRVDTVTPTGKADVECYRFGKLKWVKIYN